jgi:hypothetical protein
VAFARAGSIAVLPNELLGGLTKYDLRDYENVYDSNGNPVTNRPAAPGDTIQGVFVINQVSNANSSANYVPPFPGAVEITGVFDSFVSGVDASGNVELTPDTTTVLGQKAVTGSAFQSTYGTGAMLAVYYNNINAMPVGLNGNGVAALATASQAFSLASTNGGNGTFYASFGRGPGQTWGGSNGYYWSAREVDTGVSTFAASMAMVTNNTGIPKAQFLAMTQSPPAGFGDPGLFGIPNVFVIQGTTSAVPYGPYAIFSTDPAQLNFVPEPSTFGLIATFFATLAWPIYRFRGKRMINS